MSRRLRRHLALLLVAAALAAPACSTPGTYDLEVARPELAPLVMTRARARAILDQLPPARRHHLDQLIFLADLQTATGYEQEPLRLLRRVERELDRPTAISPTARDIVLGDMVRALARRTESRPTTPEEGYEIVREMLASAAGALPSAGECLDAIASHPPEIAVAFLVQEYFADDHYQAWKIQERIALVLATGSYGAAPLAIYEDYLRVQYPMTRPDSPYAQIVRESQRLLGDDFDRWYRSLRGKSYRRATWRR
ncbi:MAG: hypothetical protein KC420_11555 [Myxococcales bacterium]|nr:hypothetical protein [Myxococcales bacterium]